MDLDLARARIRDRFEHGGWLAKALHASDVLETGKAMATATPESGWQTVHNFAGGTPSPPYGFPSGFSLIDQHSSLRSMIRTYLRNVESGTFLFEDVFWKPGDKQYEARLRWRGTMLVQEQILYSLHGTDSNSANIVGIQQTIDEAHAPWNQFCAAAARWPADVPKPGPGGAISEGDLIKIAENVELVAVDAYDSLGYVMWAREIADFRFEDWPSRYPERA